MAVDFADGAADMRALSSLLSLLSLAWDWFRAVVLGRASAPAWVREAVSLTTPDDDEDAIGDAVEWTPAWAQKVGSA